MILMIVAFQFYSVFPKSETVTENSVVDVFVDAAYGFVTFLI